MKSELITCRHCRGTGQEPLPRRLADVLAVVEQDGETGAPAVFMALAPHIGITGINNRLEALRRLGFVTRRKVGRQWRYQVRQPAR